MPSVTAHSQSLTTQKGTPSMGLRIFEVDPDSQPRRKNDDVVGRFRSGQQLNNRPLSLTEWRVTTGDPDVADKIADLYGGTPNQWDTKSPETLEVLTEASAVTVIFDGPRAVKSEMVLWGRNGKIRSCDGVTQAADEATGQCEGCVCPPTIKERKEAAKKGTGCEPSVLLFFTLADAPELGKFRFTSGSWNFAADIGDVEDSLKAIDGPAIAEFGLEVITWQDRTTKETRSFTKPYIKDIRPHTVKDEA
jgi:hypothetical protein